MNFKSYNHLKVEVKNQHQLWLYLNQPEKKNAISYEMIDALVETMWSAEINEQIKVIVITGSGDGFCSGGDLQQMQNQSGMFHGDSNELRLRYTAGIQKIPKTIEDISKPIIAMVNGPAIGAGCDLAMMCDFRMGSEKSVFAESFAKIGLVSGDGGGYFLIRVVGYAKALKMSLLAEPIKAEEAYQFGLLTEYGSSDHLEAITEKFAEKLTQLPSASIQMIKKSLKNAYNHDLNSHLDLVAAYQGISQRTEDHLNKIKK